uniref:Uncharacterized protein n=1 Tax=Oryza glumipatula TaxID=40148 RepID=A0A0E0B1C3_9ORYZ
MPVVAASLACNTIKRVSNCGNVTSESQIFSNTSRYKNLSLMRNPRHLGTSDIEKLYDKLRYSKFVKEHSSSAQIKGKWDAYFFWVKNLPEVIHQQKETSFLKEFRNPGDKFCVTVVLVYPQPPCNLFPDFLHEFFGKISDVGIRIKTLVTIIFHKQLACFVLL